MKTRLHFYSYFKDLAGCAAATMELPDGARVAELLDLAGQRFPGLAPARGCMLVAVGVDYAGRDQVLKDGDEVSMFPPTQGG
jgi:molybdopterin converting factor small subunit